MIRAMLERDGAYDGLFFTAVRTTGIFCRPTCPARKPRPDNVSFYGTAAAATAAGYRPCARCKPLQSTTTPDWLRVLLHAADAVPERRWTDSALREIGVEPMRVRRWFKHAYGMTFHAYMRRKRLGLALGQLAHGASIDHAALDVGYESVSGFRSAFVQTFGATPGSSDTLQPLDVARIETPLGAMVAMAEERGLVLLEFSDRPALPRETQELRERYRYTLRPGSNAHLLQVEAELHEYFLGDRRRFSVPLVTPGAPFELSVWQLLQEVAFGTMATYGDLARRLGKPQAARAVGAANGRNRLAIVVPCHRICGANGDLVGYGGGRARKRWLLDHEARIGAMRPHEQGRDTAMHAAGPTVHG